jgi:hypothetical protein
MHVFMLGSLAGPTRMLRVALMDIGNHARSEKQQSLGKMLSPRLPAAAPAGA